MADEKVLCIGNPSLRSLITSYVPPAYNDDGSLNIPRFIPVEVLPLASIVMMARNLGTPLFVPRSECEGKPEYRQICSYSVVNHLGFIGSYTRSKMSGEQRLFKKKSVGFGGHINEDDFPNGDVTLDNLELGIKREFFEELPGISHDSTFHYKGLLYFDKSDDPVHLDHAGIVYEVRTPGGSGFPVESSDPSIANLTRTSLSYWKGDIGVGVGDLEEWSQELIKVIQLPSYTFFR